MLKVKGEKKIHTHPHTHIYMYLCTCNTNNQYKKVGMAIVISYNTLK